MSEGAGVVDGRGLVDGVGLDVGVGAGGEAVGDGVAVGPGALTLFVILALQTTVAPPPLPEPLHWLIVTVRTEVVVESDATVHRTRCVPPPPFPESLHCVAVAPVVVAGKGEHETVGAVPPPAPEALHWLIVAAVGVVVPVTLLTTSMVHVTVPPPPLPDPLHWSIDVTGMADVVVDELQVMVAGALAEPWHSVSSMTELVTAPPRVFVTR